ncbi:Cyclin-dependent kinase [Pacmanvirus A23]|uniref:serine-threonine kinase n=1 Tax=Pacmanvirus A23 TaxID=1932881 RepID=UPI000A09542B|nr:serine-threonine kinase [Pacmanvirus A23]SIP85758.1 Cyclin-dependent kinase [Pacmanvirus A23]
MNSNVLGSGAYAKVITDGELAVKVISTGNFKSAIREIGFINACDHENIIKINNVKYTNEEISIYMKKYNCDLYDFMRKNNLLKINIVYKFARELINALAYIHSRGIIHGDIKPQNVLIDDEPKVVICDFGISLPNIEKYHRGKVQTCTYRAPEVDYDKNKSQYTNSIDIWSLGCILFELAAGFPIVKYQRGNEDSTIYACEFYKLNKCSSRAERLKILKSVNIRYIRKVICDKMCKYPNRYREFLDSGFIGLIAFCLRPNYNKRIDANSALSLINHIVQTGPTYNIINFQPVYFESNQTIDEMSCLVNVNYSIISLCSIQCLHTAERIYTRYKKVKENASENIKLACLFIASCIYPAPESLIHEITSIVNYNRLIRLASCVLNALSGKIL